jgi:hypothetical protein
MMHPYSSAVPLQLLVPGIGFAQNVSVGLNVLGLAAFRHVSDAAGFSKGRTLRSEVVQKTNDQQDRPPQLFDSIAAAFIVMALVYGPVTWLLLRAATVAS